jgi:hypothetical protein
MIIENGVNILSTGQENGSSLSNQLSSPEGNAALMTTGMENAVARSDSTESSAIAAFVSPDGDHALKISRSVEKASRMRCMVIDEIDSIPLKGSSKSSLESLSNVVLKFAAFALSVSLLFFLIVASYIPKSGIKQTKEIIQHGKNLVDTEHAIVASIIVNANATAVSGSLGESKKYMIKENSSNIEHLTLQTTSTLPTHTSEEATSLSLLSHTRQIRTYVETAGYCGNEANYDIASYFALLISFNGELIPFEKKSNENNEVKDHETIVGYDFNDVMIITELDQQQEQEEQQEHEVKQYEEVQRAEKMSLLQSIFAVVVITGSLVSYMKLKSFNSCKNGETELTIDEKKVDRKPQRRGAGRKRSESLEEAEQGNDKPPPLRRSGRTRGN